MKTEKNMFIITLLTLLFLPCFSQNWVINTLRSDIIGAWSRVGDFDKDNDPDILVQSGDSVLWYENLRSGWKSHLIDPTFFNSTFAYIDVADIDKDGDLDVFKATGKGDGNDVLTWDENQSKGLVWKKHIIANISATIGWMEGSYGDLDKDGDIDFVVSEFNFTTPSRGSLYWLENQGNDNWRKNSIKQGNHFYSALADIDGDNDLDIVASNGTPIWLENLTWITHNDIIRNITAPHVIGLSGDLNMDGKPDILSTTTESGYGLTFYSNPSWAKTLILQYFDGYISPLGDIDGDGDLDVAYGGNGYTQDFPLGWVENQNKGTNWVRHDITLPQTLQIIPTGIVDVDGDGDKDIVALTFDVNTGIGSVFWAANPQIRTSISGVAGSIQSRLLVSPNPSDDVIFLRADFSNNTESIIFEISNMSGQVLLHKKLSPKENTEILRNLQPGLYFLTEFSDKGVISQKIVIN